jgi:endonuclease-3 related protein
MAHLPPRVDLYQEYHALLVRLGKEQCRPQPRCAPCPVADWPAA